MGDVVRSGAVVSTEARIPGRSDFPEWASGFMESEQLV